MSKARERNLNTYPAQIVFVESDRGGSWKGRLLRPSSCVDTQNYNRPVRGTPRFDIEEGQDSRFYVTMQGGPKGSRRYVTYDSLTEAQKHGIRWAARRFRVPV